MKITIDRKFGKRLIGPTWSEVKFAISKGWMESGVAVDLALKALESDNYSQDEAELAALDFSDKLQIANKLETIASGNYELDNNKWAKIFAAWLYEHRSELENPIQSLEMLWADFDYAESIEPIANQYSYIESADRDLDTEWKNFLDGEVYSILIQPIQNFE